VLELIEGVIQLFSRARS